MEKESTIPEGFHDIKKHRPAHGSKVIMAWANGERHEATIDRHWFRYGPDVTAHAIMNQPIAWAPLSGNSMEANYSLNHSPSNKRV